MVNNPSKSNTSRRRLKFMLGFVIIPIATLIGLALLGQFIATYLPGINLQQWFHETRLIWFVVRLGFYALVIVLMVKINQKSKTAIPKTARWLIIAILIFAEAISNITLA
ncbi:hypothetical protein A6046_01040 [[Haemophilus] ducreyi]|nr:hypothetical protein [[Haemophilus] ducreyi]AKO30848.1 hypothetical protein RY60_03670 [[Haemophilus] ducreyi]AKO32286.1 hypothetical protein RZ57_03675 [[Haemophilus] ducreyi]AKO33740.1 hypothetical protein RZ58_03690 [[Haemophilus] ducreyi]AKO35188.1 hypothetical protein RZ59_03655 [[Haemophilus] ducreyi]AKO36620.1 hypothetical protein RZ61_03695 [[Haemophilus] ducreyi]